MTATAISAYVPKMPRAQKLNVYVTPAGFYDAVVAAPNQKAALAAWGTHADLFGEKLAATETDETWRQKALASPGEVLKKPRGDAAELLAQPAPPKLKAVARRVNGPAKKPSAPPPQPPPDRTTLDAAEAAVQQAEAELTCVQDEFARRRQELEEDERTALEDAAKSAEKAEAARKRAAAAYERASR